jgi:hypothetical protein
VQKENYAARVVRCAQKVLGAVKIAFSVSTLVGCCERTAAHWKDGSREMDVADFMRLAKSNTTLGAELFGLLWAELPEATRALWLKQLDRERRLLAAEEDRRRAEAEYQRVVAEAELDLGGNLVQHVRLARPARS